MIVTIDVPASDLEIRGIEVTTVYDRDDAFGAIETKTHVEIDWQSVWFDGVELEDYDENLIIDEIKNRRGLH